MKLVATYSFHWGPKAYEQIIAKGDVFEPKGTRYMNRDEHARSLVGQKAARPATPAEVHAWEAGQ